jgi:hypothetical protein
VLRISGTRKKLPTEGLFTRENQAQFIGEDDEEFVVHFEHAIDCLRIGLVYLYNLTATTYGFAQIKSDAGVSYPCLNNDYTPEQLAVYRELAEAQ